jgi:hypothetical protein
MQRENPKAWMPQACDVLTEVDSSDARQLIDLNH